MTSLPLKSRFAVSLPAAGLLGRLFRPTSADGTDLDIQRDGAGNVRIVTGKNREGASQSLEFSGWRPNEQAIFSENHQPYLTAWTSLERLPEFAIGWNFLFTVGLRTASLDLVYETVVPNYGPNAQSMLPFVAMRTPANTHQPDAALRGFFNPSSTSFSSLMSIDPTSSYQSAYDVFSRPGAGPAPNLSPGANIEGELKKASFFGPISVPPSLPMTLHKLTARRFVLHVLAGCIGGGIAGAAAGNAATVGVGCVAGAIGVALYDLVDILDPDVPSGGGGGSTSATPGTSSGSDAGSGGGVIIPSKDE
jgi:hypothetical protein